MCQFEDGAHGPAQKGFGRTIGLTVRSRCRVSEERSAIRVYRTQETPHHVLGRERGEGPSQTGLTV